jgi:anti-sigma factor RsiW
MKPTPCRLLEAYLDRELPPPERARFLAHLPDCPACTAEVEQQTRIESLLRDAARLEPLPAGLVDRTEGRWHRARKRRALRRAASLAAAALLAGLLGTTSFWPAPQRPPAPPQPPPVANTGPPARPPARVTFSPRTPVIAVPVDTGDPDITFVWVYPTARTD